MVEKQRKKGIDALGNLPRGTHLCQFYEGSQDLLDILVPYFKAGLKNNELCIWVTSEPLDESEAREAMMGSMPRFESYVEKGQIEVIPYSEWYLRDGSFDIRKALEMANSRITAMTDKGYSGIRVSGNVGWLDGKDWSDFTCYEELADSFIHENQVTVICSYPLTACGVRESLDVIRNHRLALIKQQGVWQLIENSGQRRTEAALRKSEEKYRHLFENTQIAMEVIDGETGLVVLANESTARMFGFASSDDIVGVDSMEYLCPEDRGWVASQMAEVLASGSRREIAELRVRRTDGRWLWISGMAVQSEYEGKPALLVSLMDVTSRKEAEQRLMESEKKNRLLVDNAGEGIAVIQDGVLKFINRRFTELSMYSAEELLSKPFTDFIHPDDREMVAEYHAKRMRDDTVPQSYQFRWVDREGMTKWVEVNVALLTWEGKPAALAMLNDITEQKQAERALWESEKRYRLLANNVSHVIWVTDMNLKLTYASPSISRLTGHTVKEAMSQTIADFLTPASLEIAHAAFLKAQALERDGGPSGPPPQEVEVVRKDGSTVWVESTLSFIYDSDGQPVEVMGVLRDVSERRNADIAIRESERRYRLLAENISDVIWVTDMKLRPIYFSPSVTRLLGYSVQEAMTGTLETRLTPESREAAADAFAAVLALKDTEPERASGKGTLELEFRCKDGSTVWADTTVSFLRDPAGRPVEILGVLRDINERRRVEERLRDSLRRMERTMEGTIQAMASILETKDSYTAGHQRRVSQLAYAIAREMGLSSDRCYTIRTAGLLHDLGKISLPAEILSKPGRLAEAEIALIKTHPPAAYEILKAIESFGEIAEIVLQHHERMNGSGYPLGLHGDDIVPEARILAVSDVVEAMSSHRPYRPALGLDKAREEISRNSGTLYDPEVVRACLGVFDQTGFEFGE